MAAPLKYMYGPQFFDSLCPVLSRHLPAFDDRDFIYRLFNNAWPDMELKQRVRHITRVLHNFLPERFSDAAKILTEISIELKKEERPQGFAHIFLPDYVECFGLDYPEEALSALGEITRLVSAEFAVRPFIVRYPQLSIRFLQSWSKSQDANVRRLASEGSRPRLPWAQTLAALRSDPTPVLPILENLKADPSLYVRKSVANHLNDIAKDHPALVLNIAKKWQGRHPATDWIIKHGCRTLLKGGNREALDLHGFNPDNKAVVDRLKIPSSVRIGEPLSFEFSFVNRERRAALFRLEYAIDYLTATGKTSCKIFRITESRYPPGKRVLIQRKRSFKNLSTRKHHQGNHRLTVIVNGKKLASSEFLVA